MEAYLIPWLITIIKIVIFVVLFTIIAALCEKYCPDHIKDRVINFFIPKEDEHQNFKKDHQARLGGLFNTERGNNTIQQNTYRSYQISFS